jgi:exodeoxyribonuclease V beta subunit
MSRESQPFDPIRVPLSGKTLVEASAGTGKTHAITTLFLRLVVEEERLPSEILVVTFTEAATAELRGRIRRTLLEAQAALAAIMPGEPCREPVLAALLAAAPDKLAKFRQLLERAIRALDEASISTIHGFCHRVLHDHAFGTRTRFGSELVADLGDLEEDVLHDFFRKEFAGGQSALALNLRELKITPTALRKAFDAARKHAGARKIPDPQSILDGTLRAVTELEHRYLEWGKAELDARKERRGVLGFDDLLEHVGRALEGPGSDALIASLTSRYKAALVDEFQDTDSVQGLIFERIFARSGLPLFLIGDPKQAIYGFRGADIWSYLALTRDAETFTLGTSYRSDPGLVAAVNHVFSRPAPFLVSDIEYRPVTAREGRTDHFEGAGGPVELVYIEAEEGAVGPSSKPAVRAAVNRVVAAEVARLLTGGGKLRGMASSTIVESQIAVITRTNAQCFDVQEALRQKGIHSVVIADNDVLESDEAKDVLLVLPAVVDPTRRDLLRCALASTLLGTDAGDVIELDRDATHLDAWVERFQRWHTLWVERGFMRMIRALFDDTGVPRRLLSHPAGERQLTNYLHLSELMHRASMEEHLGPAALVSWLAEQRLESRGTPEHAEIRLESDERAVRVLTAHKAKGLEFDIVLCPYLWDSFGESNVGPGKLFHDGDQPVLDLHADKKGREKNFERVKWEAHAEERRVAYVALTRAKHRLTIVWCHAKQMGSAAFCTLLHPPPVLGPTKMPPKTYTDKQSLLPDLEALAASSNGSITLRTVSWKYDAPGVDRRETARSSPKAREIERRVARFTRTESFSALTKRERDLEHELGRAPDEDEARDHDEATPEADPEVVARAADTGANESIDLRTFPRGRRAGDYFHAILEELDFADPAGPAVFDLADAKLDAFGFARSELAETRATWLAEAVRALEHFLTTPLGPAAPFRLSDVPLAKRLNELEFRVPVAAGREQTALTPSRLAAAFRSHASAELPRSYADRVERLSFPALNGFLKGYIDLVFEHQGRFYVVDYKTSHLGDTLGDYSFPRMQAEMAESHYFLQYHLYTLAVHRLLARFQKGYDYERGFGGVLYLFLKGMRPGSPYGVFFEKPPLSRLDALGHALGGEP